MTYQVLARRLRPQRFADVVGQDHVTRTLQAAIAAGRVAHAFLFTGPRGVGKTTTARLLAKALNCEHGPTPEPCNACANCKEIGEGTAFDVLEIEGRALADLLAVGAGVARLRRRAVLAVEGLGEQPRRGGLADAARPGEEEGVRHATRGDGGLQGAGHVILPDHVREALRP